MQDIQKIRSVFCEALEKEKSEEREAFLIQACRDDSRLRAEVDALLKTQSEANEFFKGSFSDIEFPLSDITEAPGKTIDRYKILEQISPVYQPKALKSA